MRKLKANPCILCRNEPSCGFYAGDFAIECNWCLISLSRHFIDYPHANFQTSARLTKEAALQGWNAKNPLPTTPKEEQDRGTQFEAQ